MKKHIKRKRTTMRQSKTESIPSPTPT